MDYYFHLWIKKKKQFKFVEISREPWTLKLTYTGTKQTQQEEFDSQPLKLSYKSVHNKNFRLKWSLLGKDLAGVISCKKLSNTAREAAGQVVLPNTKFQSVFFHAIRILT